MRPSPTLGESVHLGKGHVRTRCDQITRKSGSARLFLRRELGRKLVESKMRDLMEEGCVDSWTEKPSGRGGRARRRNWGSLAIRPFTVLGISTVAFRSSRLFRRTADRRLASPVLFKLQLSCFGLDGRILLICQFQLEDFESPQRHDRFSDSVATLGIGSRYTGWRLDEFVAECTNFWHNHGRPR
jgi:hypothetical protein